MQNSQDKGQIVRKEEEQHLEKLRSKLDSKRNMYIIRVFMGDCFGCQVPRVSKRLCSSRVSSEFRGGVSKNFCKGLDSKYLRLCELYGLCCKYSILVAAPKQP